MAKNKVMAAKNKKARVLKMQACKAGALNVSMAELMWGDWAPYWVMIKKEGVAMYKGHAEYMRKWNEGKAVTA